MSIFMSNFWNFHCFFRNHFLCTMDYDQVIDHLTRQNASEVQQQLVKLAKWWQKSMTILANFFRNWKSMIFMTKNLTKFLIEILIFWLKLYFRLKFIRTIFRYNIDQDTIMIFMSDNGADQSTDYSYMRFGHMQNAMDWNGKESVHLRGTKNLFYEGGHRNSFMWRWPRKWAPKAAF